MSEQTKHLAGRTDGQSSPDAGKVSASTPSGIMASLDQPTGHVLERPGYTSLMRGFLWAEALGRPVCMRRGRGRHGLS